MRNRKNMGNSDRNSCRSISMKKVLAVLMTFIMLFTLTGCTYNYQISDLPDILNDLFQDTESEIEYEPEYETESEPEYEPEYETESETEYEPEYETESETEYEPENETESRDEDDMNYENTNSVDEIYADETTKTLYPEYSRNWFMSRRDYGSSGKMTGEIKMLLVFVNDSKSSWSEDDISSFCDIAFKDGDDLKQQAAEWGAYVNFTYAYFNVSVPQSEEGRWEDYLMEDFFMRSDHDLEQLQKYYEELYDCADVPLLFVFNCEGRSHCSVGSRDYPFRNERPVIYAKSMGSDPSIIHEFLHLYGASDYYYPEMAEEAARKYFPDSTMLTGGREVDDLTAYLIGWTDTLTDSARGLLNDTSSMTQEMVDEGLRKTWEEWS